MKDGIINIYKQKGYTSFDVVAILRKKLKIKKIGHTGTLDPEAEGVLPVCIGKATKAVDYMIDKDKVYYAKMILGQETDTQDSTGTVIDTKEVIVSEEEIIAAINSFEGEYKQIPPMYSALKVNGKKLYQLAREGKTIERKPRDIVIHRIWDISINVPEISFRVKCSKGTYIRTLCHDIGNQLGCKAHMTALTREASGDYNLSNAKKLEEIDAYLENDNIDSLIEPIDKVFSKHKKIIISEAGQKKLYNGNKLTSEIIESIDNNERNDMNILEYYRVYDFKDNFIGLYRAVDLDEKLILKPITLFL